MNTIIWKGVPSTTIDGLLISELPPISKPPMRVSETTIDGRDGSIIEDLGYSAYDKSLTIGLHGSYDINKVIKYFTGEGEIIFGNEPDKVYTAKVIGQIDYNRLVRYRQAVVVFRVQPFKHKFNEAYKEPQTATVTGTSVVVSGGADAKLKTFSIYGKTTQDGTPMPDSPVDLVSVGAGGSINVSVTDGEGNTQTVVVQTPNGLRGIPVSSGGNYTDANGQQWVCDEIDLARGVYVQRIQALTFNGTETWLEYNYQDSYAGFFVENVLEAKHMRTIGLCNQFSVGGIKDNNVWVGVGNTAIYIISREFFNKGQSLWKEHIRANPLRINYPLTTPIETALTDEEIAACKAVLSIAQGTTITNNENANMKLEYFKPFEVFNEGLENSKPIMVLRGSGTVEISVNGVHIFDYTFPDGETEVVIDSEKEDAYLGDVLKNRNMNGEFPTLLSGTNKIEWSGYVESIEILPRSRWL